MRNSKRNRNRRPPPVVPYIYQWPFNYVPMSGMKFRQSLVNSEADAEAMRARFNAVYPEVHAAWNKAVDIEIDKMLAASGVARTHHQDRRGKTDGAT